MCQLCRTEPDCRNHSIEAMISRYHRGKMPQGGNWGAFHRSFKLEKTTARGLAIEVYRGWSYCPVYQGRRRKENFRAAWHIALDFDSKDSRSALDHLAEQDWIDYYASFAYTTPSHTDQEPKARVVWVFPEPITDLEQYEELYQALLWRFDWADRAAKDGLRLFYGSEGCKVWNNWSIFPTEAWGALVEDYRKAKPKQVPPNTVPIDPTEVSDKVLRKALDSHLDNLRGAANGEKHATLVKTAYTLGGYVAGGYYERDVIRQSLAAVIDTLPDVRDYEAAYRTIDDSIADGMLAPLHFDRPAMAGDG
jgi:hypothetical protein